MPVYKKETLRKIALFADLNEAELDLVASVAEKHTFKPGDTVYSEDKGGTSLFLIVRGVVRITKVVRFEERQTLTLLKEGEFFGEMSFIDGHQHSATAEAAEESEIVEISRASFETLVAKDPLLGYRIMMRLAFQLSALLRKMDERFVEMVNYMWGKGKV